nr:isoprenylcysteine carboxylmethyltransferase family protein [Pseudoxanthomonas sp. GM95]
MRRLETRVPPPVLLALLGLAVWWLARGMPLQFPSPALHWMGVVLMLAGVALNLLPKRGFRRVGTTVNPMRPAASTQLVTTGVYRYSRNPMYLGHVLVLIGWGLWLQTAWVLPAVLLQLAWLRALQIGPEERALDQRFGDVYRAYCAQVRRWL